MSYQLILHSAAENDLTDLPQRLQRDVVFKHLPKISESKLVGRISKFDKCRNVNFDLHYQGGEKNEE